MLIRLLVVVVAFAGFVWPLAWQGALVVAFLAGSIHFLYFWRRHHLATAWNRDAYAERQSVRVLDPLRDQGYATLYDCHHEGFRVQSLLIGPTGVWLVHAVGRSRQRRLWGDAAYLHPEEQPVPPDDEALRDRADRVGEALGGETGERVAVRPIAVVVGKDTPDGLRDSSDVPVVGVKAFSSYVTGATEVLSSRDVRRLAAAADTALSAERPPPDHPPIPPMAVKKSLWARRNGPEFLRETEFGSSEDQDGDS
ncbi:MAG TPA: hypothetical protein VGL93_13775 [Streptosporangiaceae bacterium]